MDCAGYVGFKTRGKPLKSANANDIVCEVENNRTMDTRLRDYTKQQILDSHLKGALEIVERNLLTSRSRPSRCISGIAVSCADEMDGTAVVAKGLAYSLPLPILWAHDVYSPIGKVVALSVRGEELRFEAVLCNDSVDGKSVADQVWSGLCERKMHGVSVRWRDGRKTSDGVLIGATLEELSIVAPVGADNLARVSKVWERANVIYADSRPRDTIIWSESR